MGIQASKLAGKQTGKRESKNGWVGRIFPYEKGGCNFEADPPNENTMLMLSKILEESP